MRVLVTGANGHIGAHVVRELLGRGHDVRALVRASSDLTGLQGLDVSLVTGDVLDPTSVDAATEGCDAVINLAAVYKMGVSSPEEILRPAVEGIGNVLRAAAHHRVARVVHTSSSAAVGSSTDPDAVLDETVWNDTPMSAYYQAKTDSERHAWKLAGELGLDLVCLNPSGVLGAYDYRMTPSTAFIHSLASGRAQTIPSAMSYVDARDVAWVHAEALTRGVPGERYLVCGQHLTLREFGAIVGDLTGQSVPHVPLPRFVILAYAWLSERIAALLGRPPAASLESAREFAHRYSRYDTSKARAAFDWTPRPVEEMVGETLRWLAFLGQLPGPVARRVTERWPPDPAWVRPEPSG